MFGSDQSVSTPQLMPCCSSFPVLFFRDTCIHCFYERKKKKHQFLCEISGLRKSHCALKLLSVLYRPVIEARRVGHYMAPLQRSTKFVFAKTRPHVMDERALELLDLTTCLVKKLKHAGKKVFNGSFQYINLISYGLFLSALLIVTAFQN